MSKDSTIFHTFRHKMGRKDSTFVFPHLHADSQEFRSTSSPPLCIPDFPKLPLGRKTKPLPSHRVVAGLTSLRSTLLGALLLIISLAVLTNAVEADQTLVIAIPLVGQSPVQTNTASCEGLALYVQMLEILLVIVLIVAVVALVLLIRLYRKTKF
jgi:hypothetical protein